MARTSGEGIPATDKGERREPRVISGPGMAPPVHSPTAQSTSNPASETPTMTAQQPATQTAATSTAIGDEPALDAARTWSATAGAGAQTPAPAAVTQPRN